MSITNLTGTTWEFDSNFPGEAYNAHLSGTYHVDFYSYNPQSGQNDALYDTFEMSFDQDYNNSMLMYIGNGITTNAFSNAVWNYYSCKDIKIVGGDDVDNANFISLLETYAILISSPSITVDYNGSRIATFSDTGTKTLETEGKYCNSDIVISYDAPTSITTATCSVQGQAYYTDGSLSVQTSASGQNMVAVVGSLVFCKPASKPEPGTVTSGVTLITSSGTTYKVYEVTG